MARVQSGWRSEWLVPAAAASLALIACSPALLHCYGFIDDYLFLYSAQTDPWRVSGFLWWNGRPAAILLFKLLFSFVHSIDGLTVFRVIGVCGGCVSSALLARAALRRGYLPALALLLGAWFAVLPSTLFVSTWAILCHGSVAFALALVAGELLASEDEAALSWKRATGAAALLVLATVAYQPSAMGFWLLWALTLLGPRARDWSWRRIGRLTGRFVLATIVVGVTGLAVHQLGLKISGKLGLRAELVSDVSGKLRFLLAEAWPRVADPWTAHPRPSVVVPVALLCVAGLVLTGPRDASRIALRLGVVGVCLVGCFLPSIATAENGAGSRTMISLMPLLPIVALACLQPLLMRGPTPMQRLQPIGAGIVSLTAALLAAQFLSDSVVTPQLEELTRLRAAVPTATTRRPLYVALTEEAHAFYQPIHYGEFGLPTTACRWGAIPLLELVYRETHPGFFGGAKLVKREDIAKVPSSAALLDYDQLMTPRPGEASTGAR